MYIHIFHIGFLALAANGGVPGRLGDLDIFNKKKPNIPAHCFILVKILWGLGPRPSLCSGGLHHARH
jgi:hypothetical protein